MDEEIKKNIKNLIIWVVVIIILSFVYMNIVRPSYVSLVHSCYPETFQEKYADTYVSSGNVTVTDFGTADAKATVNFEEDNIPVKMHELCHLNQFKKGLFYGCDQPMFHFANEIECYTVSSIYDLFY